MEHVWQAVHKRNKYQDLFENILFSDTILLSNQVVCAILGQMDERPVHLRKKSCNAN